MIADRDAARARALMAKLSDVQDLEIVEEVRSGARALKRAKELESEVLVIWAELIDDCSPCGSGVT